MTFSGCADAADHFHVSTTIEVKAADVSAKGDALGLYAAQVLPCESSAAATATPNAQSRIKAFVDALLGAISGTAYANHREHFDGPAAAEFMTRIALDRASARRIGEIIAPGGRYCRVLLTLARLPAAQDVPALSFSLRLSTPHGGEVNLEFRESLMLTLDKPWQADSHAAVLTITLRPNATRELLSKATTSTDDFGALSQRVVTRLAQASSARISSR